MHTLRRALGALTALFAVLFLLPGQAFAASQTVNLNFSGSGSATDVNSALAVCDPCAPDAFFTGPGPYNVSWGAGAQATVQAQASWSNPSSVALNYSQGNLRHGATLDLADTWSPGSGSVTVNYSVSGNIGLYGTDLGGTDESCSVVSITPTTCNDWHLTTTNVSIGPVTDSDTFACTMPLPGESPRTCSNTKTIQLYKADFLGLGLFTFETDLVLDESVTVTGSGVSSLRVAVVSGGTAIPNNPITFSGTSPSTVADPIFISCSQPVGTDLLYSLTSNNYTVEPATYSGDVKFKLSASALGLSASYTSPPLVSTSGAGLGPIAMTAPDQQVDLGPVEKNTTPPTVNPGGPYSGNEGSPISFDARGSTDPCGLASLTFVWNFSDGGVAYGPQPQHTFEAPGTYSGLLTATDSDGNVATATFSVTVANLPPVANAGPNMSTEWGVPVTFNGSALDPGTAEQPFLTYSWDFGDGTPSASGGASVTHTYASPGTYTATLTACDPENACGTSQTQVVVNERNTTTSYTGPISSDVTDQALLKASLVDDQGAPVVGRTVNFYADGSTTPFASAATDASGTAKVLYAFPVGSVGPHTVVAKFAGDSSYNSSQFTMPFTVNKDGIIFTYTGAVSSLPSKSLPLSATLTDDLGRPLAGKTVQFSFGAGLQGCSAVTNLSGSASCTIAKLTEKPGNYTLTTSFAGDSNYLPASVGVAFKVG
jgi:hypothetical protein